MSRSSRYHRICFLAENAGPGSFRSHLTFGVYQLQKRQVIFLTNLGVVLTESRCDMNDAGTIAHGYIGIADNVVRFFLQLCCTVIERLVFFVLQIFSFVGLQNLVGPHSPRTLSARACAR